MLLPVCSIAPTVSVSHPPLPSPKHPRCAPMGCSAHSTKCLGGGRDFFDGPPPFVLRRSNHTMNMSQCTPPIPPSPSIGTRGGVEWRALFRIPIAVKFRPGDPSPRLSRIREPYQYRITGRHGVCCVPNAHCLHMNWFAGWVASAPRRQ